MSTSGYEKSPLDDIHSKHQWEIENPWGDCKPRWGIPSGFLEETNVQYITWKADALMGDGNLSELLEARHVQFTDCKVSDKDRDRARARCRAILETLLANPVLQSLDVYYSECFGLTEHCQLVGELVQKSKTLRCLCMHGVSMNGDGLEYIIRGLFASSNSVLHRLQIGSNPRLGQKGAELVTELILRGLPNLETLSMWGPGFTREEMGPVCRALAKNTSLRYITVGVGYGITHPEGDGPTNLVLRALTPVDRLTPEQADYQEGQHNQTIQTLSINYEYEKGLANTVVQMLTVNSTLRRLGMRFFHFTRDQWKGVFTSLKFNTTIESLDLYRCGDGLNEAFEDLAELLQANTTLKHIALDDTSLESNGRSVQVEEMLKRNARLSKYLNTLTQSLTFVPPKIGRLFLCGFPRAGKTTLRRSMVGSQGSFVKRVVSSARAVMDNVHRSALDKRTQGIEIRILKSSTAKHIAIWDMAGQDEYHALHDSHYMFPDINQACVFLFLYKPIDDDGVWDVDQSKELLRRHLHYWLSFINSNSRKTGWVLPKVSVVLTHLDKLADPFGKDVTERARRYREWACDNVIDRLRSDFEGRLDIHRTVYAVNAFSSEDACGVVKHAFECFDDLFEKRLPKVPDACEKMNLVLAKWSARNTSRPIMKSGEFYALCSTGVQELKALFNEQEVPAELPSDTAGNAVSSYVDQNQQAVTSYLHDVGCIIHFREADFIVVNPNWLGQVFLGRLFKPGDETHKPIVIATKNGCVPKTTLKRVLADFIKSRKYQGFGTGDLIELMKELELCFEDELGDPNHTHYFIPSTLDDLSDLAWKGRRKLYWKVFKDGKCEPTYTGMRLQCTDQSRTFLSPGFFQRFQVYLQKYLRGLEGSSLLYEIERSLIRLKHDGVEILVESSGEDGDYVDLLMRSYSPATEARKYLYKHVVDQLRTFCASRKGCPGVALQEAILRPACVVNLTLCTHRKNQAVLKESLKQRVVKKLFEADNLEIWDEESYAESITENTRIYNERFPEVAEAGLKEEWVEAMDLLHLTDVKQAIFKYRVTISEQRYAIFQAADRLETLTGEAAKDPAHVTAAPKEQPDGPPDGTLEWTMKVYLEKMEARMADNLQVQLRRVEQTILDKLEEQRLLLAHLKASMEDMQMLHQKLHITLMEKLDQVMGFSTQLQEMPRLPYFCDNDMGLHQRFVAFVRIGTPLRLHFMCENPSKTHFVEKQTGLFLVNQKNGELYERLRPLIMGSVKVLFILLKTGLHVAAGIGKAIPDYSSIEGIVPLTAISLVAEDIMGKLKMMNAEKSSSLGASAAKAAAWQCVQEIVSPLMAQGQIPKTFQLYKVQFKSHRLRKFFWVCAKCKERAENANQLEGYNYIDD